MGVADMRKLPPWRHHKQVLSPLVRKTGSGRDQARDINIETDMKRIFITGTAGFIGYHLARLLLDEGFTVQGYDGMTDYYDVTLKQRRHQMLLQSPRFTAVEGLLEDRVLLDRTVDAFAPDVIVHLAAQAGVRYSMENPRAYIDANVIGTFNVMEAARRHKVEHLLMASSSSVYGANALMPFSETDKADTQLTIYGATKKANESMGHAYAHLYDLPTTMFRFFTVYGPWGRPDLAFYKFVDAILDGRPIDIYNHGEMYRDFTYVDDLVRGVRLLMDAVPVRPVDGVVAQGDSLSPVAPYRLVNIGNSDKVRLLDFVDAIEDALGIKAKRNYMDMQPGDLPATWANADLLKTLTGYQPQTDLRDGIATFVAWYRAYAGK
jgi:UDP-glucuronate 4-epimerase